MKKIIILSVLVFVLLGCTKKEKELKHQEFIEPIEIIEEEKYIDENNTLIGLYLDKGNRLELIDEYKVNLVSGRDVGIFTLYPSNDEEIRLSNNFGDSFYNAWISNPMYKDLKIGFNIKYSLDSGEEVSYNILDYNNAYRELYNYLYDDYKNRYSSWYSHIEESTYNEDTLYTSIKLYSAAVEGINSKILFTVFTYDGLDDFDELGEYRGSSSYTITICDINKTC